MELGALLRSMQPVLRPGIWVYCVAPPGIELSNAVATFHEDEGLTAIVSETVATRLGLPPLYRAAWITLTVHSDLNAVGFLAAITRALAGAGISCNVVSAAYHDHLFVPHDRADEAMAVLARIGSG